MVLLVLALSFLLQLRVSPVFLFSIHIVLTVEENKKRVERAGLCKEGKKKEEIVENKFIIIIFPKLAI